MKKSFKGLIAGLVMLLCSGTAFAGDFDWSQFWCNYGADMKGGTVVVDVTGGINWEFFSDFSYGMSLPYVEGSLDVCCPIWKLPFSFGAFFGTKMAFGNSFKFDADFGGQVKYHFMLPVEGLDTYIGVRLGVDAFNFTYWSFYYAGFAGVTYYFASKNFGIVAEFGYPVWAKVGISLKF